MDSFHIDENGFPVARVKPYKQVGDFLVCDVQYDVAWATELLGWVDGVASGREEPDSVSGNAFHLTVSPAEAVIENLYTEEPETRIPLTDFRNLVMSWREFISEYAGQAQTGGTS